MSNTIVRCAVMLVASFSMNFAVWDGCGSSSNSQGSSKINTNSANETSDYLQLSDSDRERYYRKFASVSWEVNSKRPWVEAEIVVARGTWGELPPGLPLSHLTIRNSSTSAKLFDNDFCGLPQSMFRRDLNGDGVEELVVIWEAASADRLQIVEVAGYKVKEILSESYRTDAVFIDLDDGKVDVLITPGFDRPDVTTRYVWRDGRFRPSGTAPYDRLKRAIALQFTKQANTKSTR